ncbi:MAG: hypothetical protein LC624_03495 [Halobacteriales archaeon]|nr:hypothetical protein [Halobacteriales archaeon]
MRALPLGLAGLLLLLALPAPAGASDLPVAWRGSLPGSGSFGLRVDSPTGSVDVDLLSSGPASGSMDTIGILLFHGDGTLRFGFAITGGPSLDRFIVEPIGGTAASPAGAGMALDLRTAGTDATCTYTCILLQIRGSAGTMKLVLWTANLGAMDATLYGDPGTGVTANVGTAQALGDPDIVHGTPDIQVQQRLSGYNGVGVKAMRDAHTEVVALHHLYGFWGYNNAKFACMFRVPLPCAQTNALDPACQAAAHVSCDTALLSWSGPSGQGQGQRTFSFLGTPAGDYRFTVDLKVDAYQPGGGVYDPTTGLFAVAYENYSYLSLADVELP